MADNISNNSLSVPYNDLYPDKYQEQKTFNSTRLYTQTEDNKSESN